MNKPINDGGSAFPQVFTDGPNERIGRDHAETYSAGGMTLRDYFATRMLNPICASGVAQNIILKPATVASQAYRFADAMLAERSKGGAE